MIITTNSNQMTAEVRGQLKSQDAAFRLNEKVDDKFREGIREAKSNSAQGIHGHFQNTKDTGCTWKGIQAVTDHNITSHV